MGFSRHCTRKYSKDTKKNDFNVVDDIVKWFTQVLALNTTIFYIVLRLGSVQCQEDGRVLHTLNRGMAP